MFSASRPFIAAQVFCAITATPASGPRARIGRTRQASPAASQLALPVRSRSHAASTTS